MNNEIKVSEKFANKLINSMFEPIDTSNWFKTTVNWLIDSEYRTYSRLDTFLKEQIDNPTPELLNLTQKYVDMEYDEAIIEILKDVKNMISYKTDKTNFGKTEYWAKASEVLSRGYDDCDGLNSLVYVMGRLAGIPVHQLYCVIGDTPLGGHFYCVYLSPSKGLLYPIDATYYPSLTPIKTRIPFILSSNCYVKIWYLFNEEGIYKSN